MNENVDYDDIDALLSTTNDEIHTTHTTIISDDIVNNMNDNQFNMKENDQQSLSFDFDDLLSSDNVKQTDPIQDMEFTVGNEMNVSPTDINDQTSIHSEIVKSDTDGIKTDEVLDVAQVNNCKPVVDDMDFLEWLDTENSTSSPAVDNEKTPSDVNVDPVDDFFEDIFGSSPEKATSTTSVVSGSSAPKTVSSGYESQVRLEALSGFPDISKLREMILSAGYIPQSCRGSVWCVLLTGESCVEDQEAEFWRPHGAAGENIDQKDVLESDCAAAIANVKGTTHAPGDLNQCQEDLHDILLLYCMRRKIAYRPLFCDMLSPLLLLPSPLQPTPRAIASSCFYSLASSFVPLINLPTPAYTRAARTLHNWLHLLLSYHAPLLVQHLDRVCPGWEQAAQETSHAEVLSQKSYDMKSADLDQLERELGLIEEPDSVSGGVETTNAGPISSVNPTERRVVGGCIPTTWLCGLFGGSVPALQACWLGDWAIVHAERYAGLYVTAALLVMYSSSLRQLDGAQFRQWIGKVVSGATNWYTLIPMPIGKGDEGSETCTSWEDFTRGWIHASAAVRHTTPSGFKESLLDMEPWATAAAENGVDDEIDDYPIFHPSVAEEMESRHVEGERRVSRIIQEKVGEKGKKLVSSVRRLRGKLRRGSESNISPDAMSANEEWVQWPQESKRFYRCVWATPAEVIPCICSNQRRTTSSRDVVSVFCEGADWTPGSTVLGVDVKGGEGMSLPRADETFSLPFFFGIDIRSEEEMKLGKFPKAFEFDPSALTDPERLSTYLVTLEPMTEIAHLCIIGAGEEYIRRAMATSTQSDDPLSNTTSSEVDAAIAEYVTVLNNVAVFFMKKGFQHVSILDGGFSAAARYLIRGGSSFTLGTALVDVDVPSLDQLLGSGTCEKHLGARKAIKTQGEEFSRSLSREEGGTGLTAAAGLMNYAGSFVATLGKQGVASQASSASAAQSRGSDGELGTKQVFEDLGKKFSMFSTSTFANLRKGVATTATTDSATDDTADPDVDKKAHGGDTWRSSGGAAEDGKGYGSSLTFVIDEDEEELDGSEGANEVEKKAIVESIPDTDRIFISKTDAERSQALAMHKLSGVTKGDHIVISREALPGALLFPCMKEKEVRDDDGELIMVPGPDGETLQPVTASVHRYLVITKERFIVLDSNGKGVGSTATVKSNHHLTELLKITFKKRHPDLVSLFISDPSAPNGEKKHVYRVNKRKEFVATLQDEEDDDSKSLVQNDGAAQR